jgi:hypothetical protein
MVSREGAHNEETRLDPTMICKTHGWTKKTLPCPWLKCPNGTLLHVYEKGKRRYVRVRDKTVRGPEYTWEKLSEKTA